MPVLAPAPTGNATQDQANLQPLITASQTTGDAVQLRPGTYVVNLLGDDRFEQPIIVGAGRHLTTLKAASSSSPVVKFRGGSGALSGGRLQDLALAPASAGSGVAVCFSGCGGVKVTNTRISGFAEGVRWWNEDPNDFTEFDTFEGTVDNTAQPFRYLTSNGVESFHGSGVVGETVVNMASSATTSVVTIERTCFPYNAPLSFTAFLTNKSQNAVWNASGGRRPSFYGTLRFELQGPASVTIAAGPASAPAVLLQGGLMMLGGGGSNAGLLSLVDRLNYDGGSTRYRPKQMDWSATLANAPRQVTANVPGSSGLAIAAVTILGPNYHTVWHLLCWQSPYNDGGSVTVLNRVYSVNSNGLAEPSFSWGGYGLYIANPGFSTSFRAYITLTPLGGENDANIIPQ